MGNKQENDVMPKTTYINIAEVSNEMERQDQMDPFYSIVSEIVTTLIPNDDSHACLLDLVQEGDEETDSESGRGRMTDEDSCNTSLSGVSKVDEEKDQTNTCRTNNFGNIIRQICLPFFLAGGGAVGAGLLLDSFVEVRHF